MRFVWHGVERQHDPVDLVNPCLEGRTFEQVSTEHVVERPVAPLINGISFGMVGRSEYSLDPEGAQQLAPYLAHKLSSSVREEPARRAEVGDHMPKEGLAHRVCGVVAIADGDGIPRVAVHKHDEERLAVVSGERSHNVDRWCVPLSSGLDGSRRLLTVAIITTHLTLGTGLGNFEANAATGLVDIAVAEELPQRLSTEMSGRVELLREFPRFSLVFKEVNVEEHIFWRLRIDRQPAETINMVLGLPRPMFNCKVVLFQHC